MRRAVLADESRAVDGKHDGQVLEAHVVAHLIVSALEDRGVDGAAGPHAAGGEACREGYGVLFADTDVEKAVRETFLEGLEAGARGHGGRDANN